MTRRLPTSRAEVVGYAPEPLRAFAYVSEPVVPFSDADLTALLLAARRFNALHDVTGKLVVLEDDERVVRFAQWVEGPESAIDAVVARIRADDRHDRIEVRRDGPVGRRRFPGWEMVYAPAGAARFVAEAATLTAG